MTIPIARAFLKLPPETQRQIVNPRAAELARDPDVLYKDVWIVWVLQHLFTLPDAPAMVFKGGTSLSKVYRAISRFSEDIDITVDFQALWPQANLMELGISNSERRRRVDALKVRVQEFVQQRVIPYLQDTAVSQGLEGLTFDFDPGKDEEPLKADILVKFPRLGESASGYLRDHVLIEFGSRNPLGPSDVHTVQVDLAEFYPTLSFPEAQVNVMNIERTFWEKLTLIHDELLRGQLREKSKRLSRHWYDVALISQGPYGAQALESVAVLRDVVDHKTLFYGHRASNYGACLTQGWRLLPDETDLEDLRQDYEKMRDVMFYGEALTFEEMVSILRGLEQQLNTSSKP